jgi:tetratricopeptide (TPR) repeat protein
MNIDSLKEQARRHEREEEWRKALDLYQKAIERLDGADEPDVSIFNRAADLHVRLGNLEEALALYHRAIDLYLEADLPNNAIAICRKIGRHLPDEVEVFRRMGQIRALQGFSVDARQNYLTFAEVLQTRGEPDRALDGLRELVERIPGDWESRILLAEGLLKRDRREEAVSQLRSAWEHLVRDGAEEERAAALRERILELDPEAVLEAPEEATAETEPMEGWGGGVVGFETTGIESPPGFGDQWEEAPAGEEDAPVGAGSEDPEAGPVHRADPEAGEGDVVPAPAVEGEPSGDEEWGGIEAWELDPEERGEEEAGTLVGPEAAAEDPGLPDISGEAEGLASEVEEGPEELPFLEIPDQELPEEVPDDGAWLDGITLESDLPGEEVRDPVTEAREAVDAAYGVEDRDALIRALLGLAGALAMQGESEAETVYGQVLQLDPGNRVALEALGRTGPFDGPLAAAPPDEPAARAEEEAPAHGLPAPHDVAAAHASEEEPGEPAGFVDLGSMILDETLGEKTTRWTVAAEEPSGDEGADFARMLSQFKAKVAENLEGEDARSQYDLGTAYKEMGLLDEAISMFQKALRMEPGHLASIEMLGQCFLDREEPQVAIQVLRRGVERGRDEEDDLVGIYYFLGQAHEAAGNPGEAREFYERVFALDINFRDVTDRLRSLR